MRRRAITDDYDGKVVSWFDEDAAEVWKTEHDTGGTWVFRTKTGKWVKNCWSRYEGSRESFYLISERDAAKWLIKNNKELPADLESTIEDIEI